MSDDAIQNHRLDGIEQRLDKHDTSLNAMAEAQTDMMVSIAELNTQVSTLIGLLRKGGPIIVLGLGAILGIDLTGAI